MSDFINAADQDDFLNPDNWGLDDADWALMQQHAAQDWVAPALAICEEMEHFSCDQLLHWGTTSSKTVSPSESGIFTAAANQPLPTVRKNSRKDLQLECSHTNCTHAGTFARQYELDRHIRVKHDGKKPFRCPFPGCFSRTAVTSYARSDKLTSHIRNVHARHAVKLLDCCVEGCKRTSLPIDLLGVHLIQAHSTGERLWSSPFRIYDEAARALYCAASTAFRQCPLWRCAKQLRLESFMDHLKAHAVEEVAESMEVLEPDGYQINMKSPPEEPVHWPVEQGQGNGEACAIVVQVECPVCHQPFESHKSLQEHIDETHIVAEEQREHFRLWKRTLSDAGKFKPRYKFKPWKIWRSERSLEGVSCPCCQHRISYQVSDHHVSMLSRPEDLKPYRRAILKLYPDFATHPVWKDLA